MNKKLSVLILSTYLTTSIIPMSAFAETTEENAILYQENQSTKGVNPGETNSGITINKDYIIVSYVDANGNVLKESKNYLDIFNALAEQSPNCEWVKLSPEYIDNYKATYVTINGVDYDAVGEIYFPFVNTELDESYIIEWHYDEKEPLSVETNTNALYHKTFFNNLGETLDYFAITDLDINLNQLSFGIDGKALEDAGNSLTEDFLRIGATTKLNTQFKYVEWYNKLESEYGILSNFQLNSNVATIKIGEEVKINYNEYVVDEDRESLEKELKPLYIYKLDENKNTVEYVSTLEYNKDINKENFFVFEGSVKNAFDGIYLISVFEMPVGTVLLEDEINNIIDEDTNIDKNNNIDNEVVSTDIINDKGNYNVPYSYLKDIGNEGLYLTKGEFTELGLWLKKSNIDTILASQDESFVLNVDINGNSLEQSPSPTILSGLSKSFYNKYEKQIIRWVNYKSNLGDKNFENDNTLEMYLLDGEYKYGDTVYLYTASNLKDGKIELVGETKVTEDNYNDVGECAKVYFNTKLDLADRTYFLTKSKVELTANGQLPDTSGLPTGVFVAGGLVIVAAGGYLVLGKRKREDTK